MLKIHFLAGIRKLLKDRYYSLTISRGSPLHENLGVSVHTRGCVTELRKNRLIIIPL